MNGCKTPLITDNIILTMSCSNANKDNDGKKHIIIISTSDIAVEEGSEVAMHKRLKIDNPNAHVDIPMNMTVEVAMVKVESS